MIAEVCRDGVEVYQTPFIHQFEFHLLTVKRQNPDEPDLINNNGPHFSLYLPNAATHALEGGSTIFDARGNGTLGNVSFVAGAAARDGTESYDVSNLCASWEFDKDGLKISIRLELGPPVLASFCYVPTKPEVGAYEIRVSIPISKLARFYMISDPTDFDWFRGKIATRFGFSIAESIEAYA